MNAIKRACEIKGSQRGLATALGVAPATVNQWCSGSRPIPTARAIQIERATGGQVRCEDILPDVDWGYLRAPFNATASAPEPHQEAA